MAASRTIVFPTPPQRPERPLYTAGSDFVRGTSADDFLHRPLMPREEKIYKQLVGLGFSPAEVLDAIFLGEIRRLMSAKDERVLRKETNALASEDAADAPSLLDAVQAFEATGARPLDAGKKPPLREFKGDDKYFGEGGDDYIADLAGNNLVSTGDGDDHILLGRGNDRVHDRGGDNHITILGGHNLVTTRDGDDTITTGPGNDVINAFDGWNVIDAGDGRNIVRGGNGFDSITVGEGDDFVEVRNGTEGQTELVDLPFLGIQDFAAHNIVVDAGGSDMIRASGSSRNTDADVPDLIFNGNDLVLSDFNGRVFGDDVIELGGGNNIVVDFGGRNRVRTLEGDDIIFTSFTRPGGDEIDAGAGNDVINPGGGRDVVRGGPGADFINLENDGWRDRLVYLEDDRSGNILATDIVLGFDGGKGKGTDLIDVSTLGLSVANLKVFNAALFGLVIGELTLPDFLIAWDVDRDDVIGQGDFFTTILADFDETTLTEDNFVFDPGLFV